MDGYDFQVKMLWWCSRYSGSRKMWSQQRLGGILIELYIGFLRLGCWDCRFTTLLSNSKWVRVIYIFTHPYLNYIGSELHRKDEKSLPVPTWTTQLRWLLQGLKAVGCFLHEHVWIAELEKLLHCVSSKNERRSVQAFFPPT